jgi:hypothetical protein
MKRVLVFLAFFITVFVVIFLLSLLLPSTITVSKSVEINASAQAVKQQITGFGQWKNWYPAFQDKNITVVQNPVSGTNLSSVSLIDTSGQKVTLILVDTTQNEIKIKVHSSSSTKVDYYFIMKHKADNQTELIWNVNTHLGWYPWKKIQGIFLDKFSGDQYVAALKDLKYAAEH